ncbi:hypothetical protein IPC229_30660 [Pseudomonas aeruginosa]|uniref:LysM peptidoglycan-binding domain-containing protein n=1 Tax=Pseudomonas aeruginosa TaxID=287 RepID=UPI000FD41D60|nr:hypothetical protein [Pseudomonas aeruginosa]RUK38955.1 hypothetical protein IPC229_30660 [Pseudomonas aeruginosa]
MTKANECTCPSGDGSLRHPCPAHPASVELAGVAANLTFINGRPAMCGCQVEYSSGGGEYSDVIYVTLCAKHSGSAILDLVATNRIALTPEYEGQWHADLYLDREIPLAKAEGATPAEAVLALMSAERIDPEQGGVDQAGGDRWDALQSIMEWTAAENIPDDRKLCLIRNAARAALAQPSPVRSSLLINGYQLRAALEFIAPDGTAKQLESEARIEWRQQDADFLEAGLYAWCAEYPEEGCVLLDEEPATAQPSPAQAEQAEPERPEVVAWQYRVTAGPQTGWSLWHPGKGEEFERSYTVERRPLMTVAQYERITAKLHDALDESDGDRWKMRSERDAANARLHEVATACATAEQERDAALAEVERLRQFERICEGLPQDAIDGGWTVQGIRGDAKRLEDQLKAALARVEELDKQCRDDVARALSLRPSQERGFAWSYLLASIKSCVKASEDAAQAQHSVPAYVSYTTRPAESLAGIALRQLKDESRWVEIRDINAHTFPDMQSHSYYPAGTVIKLPAAAPGKEGV